VVLSVRDHGPGISPEDRPKLFQRFAALSHSRTEGTGLGLFIVKKIVEAHGGQVGFDFPAEGGSVFEVSLEPVEGSASS
jgi:signal transduction histidine kinase